MSNTIESLRQKIKHAQDLHSVVRTMKALAASNIGQYEHAVLSLGDYFRAVELGLHVCFRSEHQLEHSFRESDPRPPVAIHAVVFGSDQGLVGQFNDQIVQAAVNVLSGFNSRNYVWAVGERVQERLRDAGIQQVGLFSVPSSIRSITPTLGQILLTCESNIPLHEETEFHLFYNRTVSVPVYTPVHVRLLPLDHSWKQQIVGLRWPTRNLPEVVGQPARHLRSLIREYLFVALFRACAESLASENASRLSAMQRADKNIRELLESLTGTYHHLRQTAIDEELFDVISGFEALKSEKPKRNGG